MPNTTTQKKKAPAAKGRLTPGRDCEQIGKGLPDISTLYDVLRDRAAKHLDIEADAAVSTLPDGTQVCMHCGFPAFGTDMKQCPNCGTVFKPKTKEQRQQAASARKSIVWVSVLSKAKGKLSDYVIQRQFTVESWQERGRIGKVNLDISEVYRNFIDRDGNTVSFRKPLNAFPYTCINPFKTYGAMTRAPKSIYDYGDFPRYCELDWEECINDKLEKEITRRFKRNSELRKQKTQTT